MSQAWNQTKPATSSKPTNPKVQNFLESLKNNSANGNPFRSESPFAGQNPFLEFNKQKEVEKQRIAQFHQARSQEWERVYSSKDKQIQKQIEDIRLELKELAKQIVKYDQNIQQAIQTQVVNPGSYHITFFEHIRLIISLLRKNVAEANSWLTTFKKRGAAKGAFWSNAKKGGSAYMMANEHAVSRSAG